MVAALETFVAQQAASVGVAQYLADSTVLGPLYEWPSCDFVWDAGRRVFAWWWLGEVPGGHAARISQVEPVDYGVRLHMATGVIELTGVYDQERQRQLAAWRERRDAAEIAHGLRLAVEAVAQEQAPVVAPLQEYPVIVEWQPATDEPELWVPVGAFALAAEQIVFYALPRYSSVTAVYADLLASALPVAELWDYIWRQANDYTVVRGRLAPELARSVSAAAIQAAHKAEPFSIAPAD